MQRNNGARFFPLIIIIVIAALVIAAIVSIGRAVFNSGDQSNTQAPVAVDKDREALLNTSVGRSVQMTVRGPIVAEENFMSYRITASNSERAMKVYKGYLEEETNGKSLSNNTQAYEQFVYALDKANMMKGAAEEKEAKVEDDLRGICARGYVYEYTVLSGGNEVKKLWTSTCDGSKGTLNASKDQLSQLFLAQIPGSSELIPFRQSPMFRL
ncbi:MAG: hypothetical protein WBK76_03765 [Candidatus Saccharimonadales bacterium]|jgi:hypothetical protein|nr:hypothetical protein [Patescibacteria group bacterium]